MSSSSAVGVAAIWWRASACAHLRTHATKEHLAGHRRRSATPSTQTIAQILPLLESAEDAPLLVVFPHGHNVDRERAVEHAGKENGKKAGATTVDAASLISRCARDRPHLFSCDAVWKLLSLAA